MKNKALKVLYINNGIFMLAASLLGPLYAVWVETIDASVITISFSYAFFWIITTILMFFVARVGDRLKEKEYLLMAGFLIRSIGWVGYIFVNSVPTLFIALAILAAGEACGTPAWGAVFAEHLDHGKSIANYANWSIVSNIAIGVGSAIGGVIVVSLGFTILFIIMAVLSFISFVGILFQPRKLL